MADVFKSLVPMLHSTDVVCIIHAAFTCIFDLESFIYLCEKNLLLEMVVKTVSKSPDEQKKPSITLTNRKEKNTQINK